MNDFEFHVKSELDNCNQMISLDAYRGLMKRKFHVLTFTEKVLFYQGYLMMIVDLLSGMRHL